MAKSTASRLKTTRPASPPKQAWRLKKRRAQAPHGIEQGLQRVLANCFGTKVAIVKPLAKKFAERDEMGLDASSQDIVAALIVLIKDYWPYVHTGAAVIEVAHAIKITIDWVQKRLESGQVSLDDAGAVEKSREVVRDHVAGQEEDLKRCQESGYPSSLEIEKQQRALDIRRKVLDRSIR